LTKIKADGGLCLAAIDVDTRELLMGFMAEESMLRRVLEACTNKLSSSTGWYPEALKPLASIHETFGEPY
jgi:hypothetical protein